MMIFFFLLFLNLSKSKSGSLLIGKTQDNYAGNVELKWATCLNHDNEKSIIMTMFNEMKGYMGIGFNTLPLQGAHHDTDLIVAWYDNEPNVIDMWSDSMASGCQEYGTCNKLDSEKGGENDVDLLCGEKTDDGISVTWQRLLNPDDKYDSPIKSGEIEIMWAATDVQINSWKDLNNLKNLHCFECSSPYFSTCTRECPLQSKTGYMQRDKSYSIEFWNKYEDFKQWPSCQTIENKFCDNK